MEQYIGEIKLFPYGFQPEGWMLCDGRILEIHQHRVLYALIGNKFGGYGITTFALPDLRGTEAIKGMNYYIAYEGLFPTKN